MSLEELLESAKAVRDAAAKHLGAMTDAATEQVRRKTLEMQLKKAYTEFGQLAYRQLTGDSEDGGNGEGQAELEKGIREIARLENLLRDGGAK